MVLTKRLGGSQGQFERFREAKNIFPLAGIEQRLQDCPAHSLVTTDYTVTAHWRNRQGSCFFHDDCEVTTFRADTSTQGSVLRQEYNLFPKRVLHRVRSSASSSSIQYPLVSLRSSNSCLRLLPRLPIPSIFPSIH